MARVDPVLAPALQDRMGRHEAAAVEDADRVRKLVHLDDGPCPIGNAVIVAADRDEPVMADAPFEHRCTFAWHELGRSEPVFEKDDIF